MKNRSLLRLGTACLLATLLLTGCQTSPSASAARAAGTATQSAAGPAAFDYYLLALSWAPNFCASHNGPATECGVGRRAGFVVHGLWPQMESGRPEDEPCQHTAPVAADVVRYAENFYPSAGLVQHEWQCHGVYSGLSAQDYFTAVGRAYQSLRVPQELTSLNSDQRLDAASLLREFEKANQAPAGSFVTSCHAGELVAVEACFTRDLKLRPCPEAERSCRGQLLVRAPR
ncbi:MAG: ribonuclease T [Acidobacteriota bacterium]|nr:ribonuclease T [Acidobacteriota bacterium]